MNPALLQKGSNSFRTDSEIKDHEGPDKGANYSLVENQNDLELDFKVFFFADSCC